MSFTNKTAHYELPQYEQNDIPSILTDFNGAMEDIDEAIYASASASSQASAEVDTLTATVTSVQNTVASIQSAQTADEVNIAQLQSDISSVQSTVNTNTSNIASIQNSQTADELNITQLQSDVSNVQSDVNTNTNNIATLTNYLSNVHASELKTLTVNIASGTTHQSALNQIANAILNLASSLSDNQYIHISGLTFAGLYLIVPLQSSKITNANTSISFDANGISGTSTTFYFDFVSANTNSSNCKSYSCSVSSSSTSVSDRTSTTFGSAQEVIVEYTEYTSLT